MNGIRIVYASADRVCLEKEGLVAMAEGGARMSLEARRPGTGGPISGDIVARSVAGLWERYPDDADHAAVDELFTAASAALREKKLPLANDDDA